MADQGVEALLVILDGNSEGQAYQLSKPIGAYGWTEAEAAEFQEALPGRHALILFQGIVPRLGHPP